LLKKNLVSTILLPKEKHVHSLMSMKNFVSAGPRRCSSTLERKTLPSVPRICGHSAKDDKEGPQLLTTPIAEYLFEFWLLKFNWQMIEKNMG
jgi:hypothetical protein